MTTHHLELPHYYNFTKDMGSIKSVKKYMLKDEHRHMYALTI